MVASGGCRGLGVLAGAPGGGRRPRRHGARAAGAEAGEDLLDLYSGVGLFAGCLAADLGPGSRIDAVEFSVDACRDARRNLHDLPQVRIHQGDVEAWLETGAVDTVDLVVLDPPRSGAGSAVLDHVLDLAPRAIAYVACDPASLGRDVAFLRAAGWRVDAVRGLDLFPMTQHLEAVAPLAPSRLTRPARRVAPPLR